MKNTGRLNRFLNGKGFYFALGICMIAIGVSAWTAIGKLNQNVDTAESTSSSELLTPSNIPSQTESLISSNQEEIQSKPTESLQETTEQAAAPVAKYFVYPIAGEIIKGFSNEELQYSLTYNDMRLHTAIDIKADIGTAVKSAGDGVVISAELDPVFGYTVTIDHGNGITGVYAGLNKTMTVAKGDNVKAGTNLGPLATVTCESVDAPHLHLEFYKDDTPIDPKELLQAE